jgi:hypothetical protein
MGTKAGRRSSGGEKTSRPWRVRQAGWVAAALVAVGVPLAACHDAGPVSPDSAQARNHPPEIYEPLAVAYHDERYQETVLCADPDGDSVVLRADTLPGWLAFDSLTRKLSGIPGEQNIGDHRVRLTATDGQATTTLGFTLSVRVGTSSLIFDGSWIQGLGLHLGQDGHPYRSEDFVVYSGFSSTDARRYVAGLAEEDYAELKAALATGDEEFGWRNPDHTIDIFANKLQPYIGGGMAYEGGFVVPAWDASNDWWLADSVRYNNMVKHELMHVVQGLLIGPDYPLESPDAWFTEGIAEYMAGAVTDTITRWSQVEGWREAHAGLSGLGNPIGVHRYEELPPEILQSGEAYTYYPYFELAFRYLVDPAGGGKTLSDAKAIYFDIRSGTSFADAFAAHMGMTVPYYEAHFFDLMKSYLSG